MTDRCGGHSSNPIVGGFPAEDGREERRFSLCRRGGGNYETNLPLP